MVALQGLSQAGAVFGSVSGRVEEELAIVAAMGHVIEVTRQDEPVGPRHPGYLSRLPRAYKQESGGGFWLPGPFWTLQFDLSHFAASIISVRPSS